MTKKTNNPRECALASLVSLERDGRYSNLEINSTIEHSSMSDADRGLYTRLVYGVTERRITLDHIIGEYSSLSEDELDSDIKTALRIGLYQLIFMDRIPEHAAVSSSVELVPRRKSGYVNAVLRSFLRAGKKYFLPDKNDTLNYLSVKYSVPVELCALFNKYYSGEELEDLLFTMNKEPRISLRVNTLKISAERARPECGGELSKLAPDTILIPSFTDTVKRGIDEGLWFVQDEASRITSAAVGACSGETVADVCACPGGKSFSMAVDMRNEGKLYSFDIHKNKLPLVEKGAERLGITIIQTEKRDAREPNPELIGKIDRVLCDAPCSGLGVIAKKPEVRFKDLSAISSLPEIQYNVLTGASKYVKNGGILVYSTCTLNKAENEEVVERFLAANPNFTLYDDVYLKGGIRTFLPHKDGCDGFFAAKMRKSNK